MNFQTFPFGRIASMLQVALIMIGSPHHIYLMYSQRSAATTSLIEQGLILIACLGWLGHGLQKKDLAITIPQIPAITMTLVIVALCLAY